LLLDVESGAVHTVDELIFDVAKLFENLTTSEIIDALSSEYSQADIIEALDELNILKNDGLLCAPNNDALVLEVTAKNSSTIKAMCLHIAHDCNLRCKYCFASTGDFKGERLLMPLETAKAALDFLVAHSANRKNLEVDFFGGEPLMNFEVLKQTVEYGRELEKIHNKQFKFTVTTNCVILNEEILDFINKEMVNVVLSIDGQAEVHNKMRRTINDKPSFDIVLANAKKIAAARNQQRYYVRGTFTAYNLHFAKDVLFLADCGFQQLSIEPVVAKESELYALKKEHISIISQEYEDLAKEYLDRRKNGNGFNFFHFMVDLSGGPCLPKRVSGCGVGSEYVAITPEGDIYPCHQFVGVAEKKMGNVHTGKFDVSSQSEYKACNVLTKEKCRDCWAKYYCSGGCAANAYNFNGDIYSPFDIACEFQKKRTECALAIYAIEKGDEEIND